MSNSYLPYGRQTITDADIQSVVDVLRSPLLTQGPALVEFEQKVAHMVGADHATAVNSATSALHIACLALDLGPGDWLWTSSITFVASANCGLYTGASIDFVDINPSTGLMDEILLREKLEKSKSRGELPKVVIPVHLTGSSCNMYEIKKLSEEYGFKIVEDASHAIGGSYKKNPVGSCQYSDITVFSFHPVKIITTAEGGMATTNNIQLAEKMNQLRSHGITKDEKKFLRPSDGPWSYEQQYLGFNYRMTELQAALGLSQLNRLATIVLERNHLYQQYSKLLKDLPLKLLAIPSDTISSVHLAVIILDQSICHYHRIIFERMRNSGIGVQLHYTPVHLQPYYRNLGFSDTYLPKTEVYAKSAMSLPLFPGLTSQEQTRIVDTLSAIIGEIKL